MDIPISVTQGNLPRDAQKMTIVDVFILYLFLIGLNKEENMGHKDIMKLVVVTALLLLICFYLGKQEGGEATNQTLQFSRSNLK